MSKKGLHPCRDGLERIQVPDNTTVNALREHISEALAVPVDDITLSRNQALVRSALPLCCSLPRQTPCIFLPRLKSCLQQPTVELYQQRQQALGSCYARHTYV